MVKGPLVPMGLSSLPTLASFPFPLQRRVHCSQSVLSTGSAFLASPALAASVQPYFLPPTSKSTPVLNKDLFLKNLFPMLYQKDLYIFIFGGSHYSDSWDLIKPPCFFFFFSPWAHLSLTLSSLWLASDLISDFSSSNYRAERQIQLCIGIWSE